jgi:hypothetical protein
MTQPTVRMSEGLALPPGYRSDRSPPPTTVAGAVPLPAPLIDPASCERHPRPPSHSAEMTVALLRLSAGLPRRVDHHLLS